MIDIYKKRSKKELATENKRIRAEYEHKTSQSENERLITLCFSQIERLIREGDIRAIKLFLEARAKYLGFGAINENDNNDNSQIIIEAVRKLRNETKTNND